MIKILKGITKNWGYTEEDKKSLLWNGVIIAVSSFIVFVLEHVKISFGIDPILEAAIVTFIIKALNKFISDTSANIAIATPAVK